MGRLNDDDLLKLLTLINPMAFDTSQEGSMLLSHDLFFLARINLAECKMMNIMKCLTNGSFMFDLG